MKFYSIFLRYFVVGLLFFPTIVQNIHNLIHHEHLHCNTSSLHFHEIENECELIDNFIISDFSIVNKNYISFSYLFQNFSNLKQSNYTNHNLLQRLRAPPIFNYFL